MKSLYCIFTASAMQFIRCSRNRNIQFLLTKIFYNRYVLVTPSSVVPDINGSSHTNSHVNYGNFHVTGLAALLSASVHAGDSHQSACTSLNGLLREKNRQDYPHFGKWALLPFRNREL